MLCTASAGYGRYGLDKEGSFVHLQLSSENSKRKSLNNKEVILLVDLSASMEESLDYLMSSLLTFKDLLTDDINLRLITFSIEAEEIWHPGSPITFQEAVYNLSTKSLTNMGAGLELVFSKVNPDIFTWIIVMTDGDSNKGDYRTADSFNRLVNVNKPFNSKIITLGYGKDFNSEILHKVGDFSYIERKEMIPIVLGNLSEEILYSFGFNLVIDAQNIIVGNRLISSLLSENIYDIIFLSSNRKNVKLSYTDIETKKIVDYEIPILRREIDISYIRSKYYEQLKRELLYSLYQSNNDIKLKLDSWSDIESLEHKKEILELMNVLASPTHTMNSALSISEGLDYTNMNSDAATTAINTSNRYLESPYIKLRPP